VIALIVILAAVIFAIALFSLQSNRLPTTQARIYAVAFAVVFVAGAAVHRLAEHRPDNIAPAPAAIAPDETNPSDAQGSAAAPGAVDIKALNLVGPKTAGSVDLVEVTKAGTLHIRGWALAVSGRPASALVAIIDHTKRVDITNLYGQPRPDVVASLKNPEARRSGFDGVVPLPTLSAGPHSVDVVVASSDRNSFQYPSNATHLFSLH
jgi:hypothetical protein